MRVAMISEHASPLAALGGVDSGGQNVYVSQLAYALASFGYEVDVFTRRDHPARNGIVKLCDNLRVIHVPAGPPRYVRKEDMLPYMTEFTRYMYHYFQQEKPYDLIHANFWMSGLVAMHLKHLLAIPFVITFHALGKVRRIHQKEADEFPDDRVQIEERIMREADSIIAECPQDRIDMAELYHADLSKVTVIPCGFNPDEFDPIPKREARQKLGWPEDEKIILQLGRIVPRKGIETVIRGFAKFRKTEDTTPARLFIVGGNTSEPDPSATPEIGRLQKIASEEGVAETVHFTGQVDRRLLGCCYSAADVFVTMPWYEPFGITPLEAMACGTPVIGSDVGGIKYTVKHGSTGFLVPSQNTDALADCLKEFFKNLEYMAQMGQEALKRVNQFTWYKIARKISNLYEEVYAPYAYPSGIS
jgi:D-inositol-3-phosphate glycosyltransferase